MNVSIKLISFYRIAIITLFFAGCITNSDPLKPFHLYEWEISTPSENGLDSQLLQTASDSAQKTGFVYSLLVIRNDKLVYESYFHEFNKYSAFNIKSVSKSFISALIGIAVEKKFISSVFDQPLVFYFPEYAANYPDQRINDIMLVHLLTMRAGFDYDDRYAYQFFSSENWIESTFQLPLIHDPGSFWNYTTPLTHLLSVILTKATNMSTRDFAYHYLFSPLGIEDKHWVKDPQGYYLGGSEMYFTSRDLARFGSLYLNNGIINNLQILPEQWVNQSIQDYTEKEDWAWGSFTNIGYGFCWWLGILNDHDVFFALGYGGQYIVVVPYLKLIIVTTCDASFMDVDLADSHERWISHSISAYILPAVIDQ